jgi:dTDP-4-dehydrorhamnose reductase
VASAPAKLLVVVGDSMIGAALADHFSARGWQVQATTRRRDQVDEAHPFLNLAAPMGDLANADVVILAAAMARIGDCEDDPDGTRQINVDGTLAVAQGMAGQGAHVILLSSDKVFDGTVPLRDRNDDPCPACEYGRQKAAAEAGVLALGDQGAVLRLSKVLEPGLELLTGWARELFAGNAITPFHDLYLAPVPVDLVVQLAMHIAVERVAGIFHCTGAEDRSYVDLAHILAEEIARDPDLIQPGSCQTANIPAAARPRHTTLEMTVEQIRWGLTAPAFEVTARTIISGTSNHAA